MGGDSRNGARLEVTASETAGTARLALAGELDMGTVAVLDAALSDLESSRPRAVLVDLARLDFMDSTGLRALLSARRRASDAGSSLRLANPPPAVSRVLDITGARRMFEASTDG
jgi:anti-sigma B factor antagonist